MFEEWPDEADTAGLRPAQARCRRHGALRSDLGTPIHGRARGGVPAGARIRCADRVSGAWRGNWPGSSCPTDSIQVQEER